MEDFETHNFDVRLLITSGAEIRPIEGKAQAPNRALHSRQCLRAGPFLRIPERNDGITPANCKKVPPRFQLEAETGTGVRIDGVKGLKGRPVPKFHEPRASRKEKDIPTMRPDDLVRLDRSNSINDLHLGGCIHCLLTWTFSLWVLMI